MVEIFREISCEAGKIYIIVLDRNRNIYSATRLARDIAEEYNVDSNALLNNEYVRELYNKYSKYSNLSIKIYKDTKTSDEIKREIKSVTRDLERFINVLIDRAEELREQQNLEEWLWKEAKYDPEKRRFVKVVRGVDF